MVTYQKKILTLLSHFSWWQKKTCLVNEDVRVISLLIIFFLKTINVMHTDFSQEQKDLFGIIVFMAFIAEKRVTTVFTYC